MHRITLITYLTILALSNWLQAGVSSDLHPFTPEDLFSFKRIGQIRVSPDGGLIAFEVRTVDMEANRLRADLWVTDRLGNDPRPLTTHPEDDICPQWDPNGKQVWFLSKRSGSWQVWSIAIDGGQARQRTDLPLDLANLKLSPAGTHIAFTAEVFLDTDMAQTRQQLDLVAGQKATGRIYDRLFIRHWDRWSDGRRSHLFLMPTDGGQPIDLMKGMDGDCPSVPFGGPEEFAFTPDGKAIVFTARLAGRAEAWSTDYDLFIVPVDGSSMPRCLTPDNPAWDTHPVFSPDGRYLAYLAMARPGYESDRFRIVIRQWPDGPARILAPDWDRSPSAIAWSKDSALIYAIAPHLGQQGLFSVDIRTGVVKTIWANGSVEGLEVTSDGLFIGLSSFCQPTEIYQLRPDARGPQRITDLNGQMLARIRMGAVEQFTFEGADGDQVYAYIVSPPNLDPNARYPLVMLIHGGPQGSFSNNFHYRWNPQIYAGAGYGVLMVDFHGSVGYGQAFTDSVRTDWGGRPLLDLKLGLAAAIRRYRWIDGRDVAALGASYGGYMINWIAGNWPDRFRCLVNHAGSLDERIGYFDTEELWFPEWEYAGQPWTNPQTYEQFNPINYVANFRTPMLVIHGEGDYRVPYTQGIATFTALQRLGIPSKFLCFPDEGHWVLKPHNSLQWHRTVLAWLAQWLAPNMPAL
ncbi:MAG: S9 family peptidase [Sedimentisphaerales bacterium]|jgi:dipeptidyl aminopeptidase/acylaminoacyl peptidase|nr:S9 family peptidase [Sedimentisphaerales bacterium]